MKILYLHQYFNTLQDSGGTRSYEMARRLVDSGHQVEMITSLRRIRKGEVNDWFETVESGIHVHWLPVPYSNTMSYWDRIVAFLKFAWGAARKASKLEADVVFATSTPLTIALPAVFAAKKQQIPMVFEVRDLWPELPISVGALKGPMIPIARRLEKFAYHNAEQIVALSPGMKEGIVRAAYPNKKIHVIPNSADLDLFDVDGDVGIAFRTQFEWLQNRPLVVYVGTLGKINGVDYLTKVAATALSSSPEIRFLVVGDGAKKRDIKELAEYLGVYNKNFFMMDSVPKEQVPEILSAADIATSLFVNLPEMWSNSANKFFDALASGTPVAINYLGWQAKLLTKTGAGFILDPVDVESSTNELLKKLNNKDWLIQAGKLARKLAKTQFSRDLLSKQLEKVLQLAVESGKYEYSTYSKAN